MILSCNSPLSKILFLVPFLACCLQGGMVKAQTITAHDIFEVMQFSQVSIDSISFHTNIDLYSWEKREFYTSGKMYSNNNPPPFACVLKEQLPVVVQFRSFGEDTLLAIWAQGNYGTLKPELVRFNPAPDGKGKIGRDTFWFRPPPAVDVEEVEWRWRSNGWSNFDTTRTTMHALLSKPNAPHKVPYVELLGMVCNWARGAISSSEAARGITQGLKFLSSTVGNISYNANFDEIVNLDNVRGSGSFYAIQELPGGEQELHFSLSYFLRALQIPGVSVRVICYDMAALSNLCLASVGADDVKIRAIGDWKWPYYPRDTVLTCKWFNTNPLHPIGNYVSYTTFRTPDKHFSKAANLFFVKTGFSSHAFVTQAGKVFDATFDLLPNKPAAAMLDYGSIDEDTYLKLFVAPDTSQDVPPLCGPTDVPRSTLLDGGLELLRFPDIYLSGGDYPTIRPVDSSTYMMGLLGESGSGLWVESIPRLHPPGIVQAFFKKTEDKYVRVASLTFGAEMDTLHNPPDASAHFYLSTDTPDVFRNAHTDHLSGQEGRVGYTVYSDSTISKDTVDQLAFWQGVAQRGNNYSQDTVPQGILDFVAQNMLPDTLEIGKMVSAALPERWRSVYFLNFFAASGSFFLLGSEAHFLPEKLGRHHVECDLLTTNWAGKMIKEVVVVAPKSP